MMNLDNKWGMKPDKDKALMIARRQLSEFVHDAVNLEGINITLPEVQTLLFGVTVGGHKISDQQVVINQGNAWRELFELVKTGFCIDIETVCNIHKIAGYQEALMAGNFRVGRVTISGTDYMPPESYLLRPLFHQMIQDASELDDVYDKAIHFFLTMARMQFFYDVNKRMGKFVMNLFLLSKGYPAINLPAKRQLEFNTLMLLFYETNDQKLMNEFLRSCLDIKIIEIMNE